MVIYSFCNKYAVVIILNIASEIIGDLHMKVRVLLNTINNNLHNNAYVITMCYHQLGLFFPLSLENEGVVRCNSFSFSVYFCRSNRMAVIILCYHLTRQQRLR